MSENEWAELRAIERLFTPNLGVGFLDAERAKIRRRAQQRILEHRWEFLGHDPDCRGDGDPDCTCAEREGLEPEDPSN